MVTVVDPGVGTARRPVLCGTCSDKWFVGPDNGVLTHVLREQGLREAYELTQSDYFLPDVSATFHGRDIFSPVAAHLACGVPAANFGIRVEVLNTLSLNFPRVLEDAVEGEVVHIDHYGNIVTNITPDLVRGLRVGCNLSFTVDERRWTVPFCATYGAQPAGQLLALVSSGSTLEIACAEGDAGARVKALAGTAITFQFPS